jgi:hypothetical protein
LPAPSAPHVTAAPITAYTDMRKFTLSAVFLST